MMKLNIEETMAAQTYAAYMIASSYFDSYVCTSRQMERQTLKVHIEKDMYTGIERKHYQVDIIFRHTEENTAA